MITIIVEGVEHKFYSDDLTSALHKASAFLSKLDEESRVF